jgi:hypothetical protein
LFVKKKMPGTELTWRVQFTAATYKPGLNESRLRYFVQMLWRESCVW